MSSDEEGPKSKSRKVQRACDICRRKKSASPNMICFPFEAYCADHLFLASPIYVEGLENRVEKMERLLRQIMPDEDFRKELGSFSHNPDSWSIPKREFILGQEAPICDIPHADIAVDAIRKWDATPSDTKENIDAKKEEDEHLVLSDSIRRLAINPEQSRFFGKSSGIMLIRTAMDLKNEYTGMEIDLSPAKVSQRRPEFWQARPWERTSIGQNQRVRYNFPEEDLMRHLVDLYFKNINVFIPLLHRPTFERNIVENLHLQNDMFGAVLLLVCANGSRYSNDPRVLLDGVNSWLSCGWRWFDQVQLVRNSLLSPPTLYDLQFYCGSSAPHACWTMVGMGIRLAQDIGAHRRRISTELTVEDELMKRAFWALVSMDHTISAGLGRPCAIQDEDFDLEMPVECDDEYWEHPDPNQAFRQPPGRPSYVAAFNSYLKLMRLLGIALRTIYCINKSKILLGFAGPQWEQRIVAELDSALNQWVDSVPEHLRWDPNREDNIFFNQSVVLYTQYYQLQILIHRPFIPSPKRPSPLSFPSLAICTNAARSCSHIVDCQRKRKGFLLPWNLSSVFGAGIVLLLNIWGGKRSGLSTDPSREMKDVHKCMEVLRACESRWHSAGRLWWVMLLICLCESKTLKLQRRDILYELASVGDLPLPKSSPASQKRERDSDSPRSSAGDNSPVASGVHTSGDMSDATPAPGSRTIAGSRRAAMKSPAASSTSSANTPPPSAGTQDGQPPHQLFSLPMYSDELGRLPLHGQLNYTSQRSAGEAGAMDAGGYWFTPQEASGSGSGLDTQMSAAHAAQMNGMDSSVLMGTGAAPDLSLPAGYPALADAEFFDQLTSMTWPNASGRTSSAGMGSYVGGGGLLGSEQHEVNGGTGMDALWSNTDQTGYGYVEFVHFVD
ncbi:Gypsy retrotransposon integrase-like protein 1 [Paramarasmius palmivorus]|uniref:Gypsy retrotransposon integrase-like protein 1 n=1 Tax=Paramarasmius palmivorus TaxID=297713 RepID=A0AAW0BDN3_9AGAR